DQLALAATDRGHGVDGLDAGLQRFLHGLAGDDARRLHLEAAAGVRRDRPPAVDRLAEWVDDAAQQAVAHRDREDAARRPGRLALLDVFDVAQDDGADRVLVEIEGKAEEAAFELQQLVDGRVRQPGDTGDAVADLDDA